MRVVSASIEFLKGLKPKRLIGRIMTKKTKADKFLKVTSLL